MPDECRAKSKVIRLRVGFITDLADADAIVYYARPDLTLGSGFGTAIAIQGGPTIQDALKKLGPAETTDCVVTGGGNLPVKWILHAVGPCFQEEDGDEKLRKTMFNALENAEALKLQKIAFPAMGAGFYGFPLEVCARVTLGAVMDYLKKATQLKEILFCLRDLRELKVFQEQLQGMEETASTGGVG